SAGQTPRYRPFRGAARRRRGAGLPQRRRCGADRQPHGVGQPDALPHRPHRHPVRRPVADRAAGRRSAQGHRHDPAAAAPLQLPRRRRMTEGHGGHPSVGVVIPTHSRPELLRAALDAVLAQDYPGELRVAVVFDRAEPDPSLADVPGADGRVTVLANDRTPGLAGARNTGILALDTELVAFCDDDDAWLPEKLTAQTAALVGRPDAVLASCGILVRIRGDDSARLAGSAGGTHADRTRPRAGLVHPPTYRARRPAPTGPGRP